MRLYAGSTTDFITDTARNQIASRLEHAFIATFRFRPPASEVRSWQESLTRLSATISHSGLTDNGILLEYQLPLTSRRIDAIVTGRDKDELDQAVIVELKQWQRTEPTDAEGMICTWVGGNHRDVLHPSMQAGGYRDYLVDMHAAFHEGKDPLRLSACAYLHNYNPDQQDPLFDSKFDEIRASIPLFCSNDQPDLEEYLCTRVDQGKGLPILERIDKGQIRPSKKLLDHVATVIAGEPRFVLLDEQQVVFERAMAEATRGWTDTKKRVLIIQGGPGTGKSVLAINLQGKLSKQGLNAHYVTGSRAFTETLRKIVGARASAQFKYSHQYMLAEPDSVDVLICDEAHRIRKFSTNQYTRQEKRATARPQVEELLSAGKVSVFFIDDRQLVSPNEIGSADLIRTSAKALGAVVKEYRLEAQFRCAGSDAFVNWVDNTLGIAPTANQVWNQTGASFEFRVFSSIESLDAAIRTRQNEGSSARLVAGFCWPWSKKLDGQGNLVEDVTIGTFRRPWNAPPEMTRLPRGTPKATLWATDPGGIGQVGCIYTAQGFEFDYVGVIWGLDLQFDPVKQEWIADRDASKDTSVRRSGAEFEHFVKNTYRVLLSRGIKGCYVYCQDTETAKFLLSRTEGLRLDESLAKIDQPARTSNVVPLRPLSSKELKPYKNCLPVLDLKAAAGTFGEFQAPDVETAQWVEAPSGVKPGLDLFITQVVGESMNKVIPNGAWCLFRLNPAGSRNGKIVLAQLRTYYDPETGGQYTVKRYESRGALDEIGRSILLKPESTDPSYEPIVLAAEDEGVRVIAELIRVL